MFAGGADGNGHLPRPRRPRRVGAMGSPPDQAGSAPPHPAPPPCTDYDMAYFKAYSHLGVHEEMLKVTRRAHALRPPSHFSLCGFCSG
jgi:protein arginine N-methyltransferase 6